MLSQSRNFEELTKILDEMKELGKFKGVLLAYRNGGLIAENMGNNFDGAEFAAMCASVLESAEGLGQTMDVKKIGKIIAELEEQTIIINECDLNTFLVFIIERESKVEVIFNKLNEYSQKIIEKI